MGMGSFLVLCPLIVLVLLVGLGPVSSLETAAEQTRRWHRQCELQQQEANAGGWFFRKCMKNQKSQAHTGEEPLVHFATYVPFPSLCDRKKMSEHTTVLRCFYPSPLSHHALRP